MITLSEGQVAEVTRIIEETPIQTDWQFDDEIGEEVEIDDARMTLVEAARRVREYVASIG